mmetsp:Transcript_38052/g.101196  ORF Transcript_38052/g.101196 Transcript_38052/m.101196 type:complete len:312 (-) Transcript_38052:2656-3591(-)
MDRGHCGQVLRTKELRLGRRASAAAACSGHRRVCAEHQGQVIGRPVCQRGSGRVLYVPKDPDVFAEEAVVADCRTRGRGNSLAPNPSPPFSLLEARAPRSRVVDLITDNVREDAGAGAAPAPNAGATPTPGACAATTPGVGTALTPVRIRGIAASLLSVTEDELTAALREVVDEYTSGDLIRVLRVIKFFRQRLEAHADLRKLYKTRGKRHKCLPWMRPSQRWSGPPWSTSGGRKTMTSLRRVNSSGWHASSRRLWRRITTSLITAAGHLWPCSTSMSPRDRTTSAPLSRSWKLWLWRGRPWLTSTSTLQS